MNTPRLSSPHSAAATSSAVVLRKRRGPAKLQLTSTGCQYFPFWLRPLLDSHRRHRRHAGERTISRDRRRAACRLEKTGDLSLDSLWKWRTWDDKINHPERWRSPVDGSPKEPRSSSLLVADKACWLLGKKSRAQEAGRRLELPVMFYAGHASTQRACRLEQFGLINGSIHSYPASSINALRPQPVSRTW